MKTGVLDEVKDAGAKSKMQGEARGKRLIKTRVATEAPGICRGTKLPVTRLRISSHVRDDPTSAYFRAVGGVSQAHSRLSILYDSPIVASFNPFGSADCNHVVPLPRG